MKFNSGDWCYLWGPGWVKVTDANSTGFIASCEKTGLTWNFDQEGKERPNFNQAAFTVQEAKSMLNVDFPKELRTKVKVYAWEKVARREDGLIVVQQATFLTPRGSWLERDGWTVVPNSERTIEV